jgi:hypothetical protein
MANRLYTQFLLRDFGNDLSNGGETGSLNPCENRIMLERRINQKLQTWLNLIKQSLFVAAYFLSRASLFFLF